ncbi:MAG TPA: pyridoxamine 5'-phosphate oxidase family protein [Acidisoma sp.]|nr:pyridoxamine 5'-phosphate oxidase family protein [Acidisoma sp.]
MPDTMAETRFPVTERSRVRREHHRGRYEKEAVYAVLDAAPLCHVGYVIDGAPYVTPTIHWRHGNRLYWHGSAASRFLRAAEDMPVCLTVSLMDGYVLARSAFNHSVNYRAVMAFGTARKIEDAAQAAEALRHFTEGLFPGRWETLRPVTAQELKATVVLWMEIDEATVKTRTGGPGDAEESDFPVWAGVIPMRSRLDTAEPAPELPADCALPAPLAELIASGRLR